ncbi:hypothetical protein BSBH6_00850 [Bacillus subtilis]|nr:hypothetical protein BSBH6_00850 [Bacillus subtilis]RPK27212.1 hypothetical protein BH5_00848 [Bacillus subtilis]
MFIGMISAKTMIKTYSTTAMTDDDLKSYATLFMLAVK